MDLFTLIAPKGVDKAPPEVLVVSTREVPTL